MADMLSEMLVLLMIVGAVSLMIIGGIMDMVDDYRQPHRVRARAEKRRARDAQRRDKRLAAYWRGFERRAAKEAKRNAPALRVAKVTNRARRNAHAFARAMSNDAALRTAIRAKRIEAMLAARGWGLGQ